MYDNIQKSVNYSRGAPLKLNYLGTKGLGLCLFLDLFRKVSPLFHIINKSHFHRMKKLCCFKSFLVITPSYIFFFPLLLRDASPRYYVVSFHTSRFGWNTFVKNCRYLGTTNL